MSASEKSKTSKSSKIASKKLPSAVEQHYLELSGRKLRFDPTERINVIEVANFPLLGRMTALRFLEWVLENPEGLVSLPTGKTPEYFIRWAQHYIKNWTKKDVVKELETIGVSTKNKPALKGLRFVQIDEFYPINPAQANSFHHYVSTHYIKGFGLDPKRAMLMDPTAMGIPAGMTIEDVYPGGRVDLSLRSRNPVNKLEELQSRVIESVDQFCTDYEEKIRSHGGIGFFLGGIGPDGHIGFNPRGSHHESPTRLTYTNYETEAAAASDLGGIEVSRNKPVITIGLGTLRYNRDAVVLVFAAGEGKSKVVADAIQNDRSVLYPASILQDMPNGRIYLTTGATTRLTERRLDDIEKAEKVSDVDLQRAVINRAVALDLRLDQLTQKHVADDPQLKLLLGRTGQTLPDVAAWTRASILSKIERGMDDMQDQSILHTGPHHDDIMLGYMPYVMHLVRRASNRNYFNVLTSGFTAVTNKFLGDIFNDCLRYIDAGVYKAEEKAGAFKPGNSTARAEEVYRYLDGIASMNEDTRRIAQARRMAFNLMVIHGEKNLDGVRFRIEENLRYLAAQYPGKKDIPIIQTLKGAQREYEEELIWGYVGTSPDDVFHSRLGFYTGDIFTEQPTLDRDVAPVLELMEKLQPSVVSLAFDPEGAGPDTHYKVLQVLHEALIRFSKKTGKSPKVWGYRNVWFRFHPAESNIYVPATLNTMAIMTDSFMHCFGSQKNASFPSYEYDGPFCYQAQALWVEQFKMLKTCLGERFFTENPSPRLRAARGFVFFREMALDEFSGAARGLAKATEAV